MSVFRFLAALFALIAIIAFISDATPQITGTGPFVPTTLEAQWERSSPNSLKGAQSNVSDGISPGVWTALEAIALRRPTWGVFGVLALISGLIGRRRHRINVYVN
jgi:hypothetical protein